MITLCVPIITILVLYAHSEFTVRERIYTSGENALNQYYAAVDTIAEEMCSVSIAVAFDEECQKYVRFANYQPKKMAHQALSVSDVLARFLEERYFDIFVYYPYQDRIISAQNAVGTAWHYYNSYYSAMTVKQEESEDWQHFQQIIHCDSSKPVFDTLVLNGKNYLCASVRQFERNGEKFDYTVVVVLDAAYLEKLMGVDEMDTDVNVMMFNQNRELMLTTNAELSEAVLPEEYLSGQQHYETEIGDKDYMVYVRDSDNLKGYYALAIPSASFWAMLNRLRMTTGMGIVVSIVCSILIALQGGIRSWRPVEKTLERLTTDMDEYQVEAANELEYVERMFEKENEKKWQMYGKARTTEALQQEKRIMSLLEGGIPGEGNPNKDGSITFRYDYFFVCSMAMDKSENMDAGLFSFSMRNVWEELCEQVGVGYVTTYSEKKAAMLINCPTGDDEAGVLKVLQRGCDFFKTYYKVVFTVGFSELHVGTEEIPTAYEEAERALEYRYLYGSERILLYRDIKNRELQLEAFEGKNLSAALMGHIQDKKQERTSDEFVSDLFTQFGISQEISLDTLECFRFELLNAAHYVMMYCQYPQDEKQERLEMLLQANSMENFRNALTELMEDLRQTNQNKEMQKDICTQAKNCIEENYADSNLSLEFLGSQIGCSPAYLSRKFKEKYGVSVLEFITEERIREAKRLLVETSISVREIAEKTGYLSDATFVKTFRKKVGVTPGNYREIYKENKS